MVVVASSFAAMSTIETKMYACPPPYFVCFKGFAAFAEAETGTQTWWCLLIFMIIFIIIT